MNIMLVDDDIIIREGMKKIIQKADRDWKVKAEAGDGEEALRKLEQMPEINLLITDVRMPIMDGIELIRKIRKKDIKIRIIVLSGFDEFDYVRSAFMNGAVDYLLKPFQKEDLLTRLENIEENILSDKVTENHKRKNKNVLIADIMMRLLKDDGEVKSEEIEEMEALGVNIQYPCYLVAAICADQYYGQHQDVQQYEKHLHNDMEKIVMGLKEKKDYEYCFCMDEQEILMILFCNSEIQGELLLKKVFTDLNDCSDELITNSMGVSNVHNQISEMKQAYKEAWEAIQSRFYLGQKNRIHYNEISGKCIDIRYELEQPVSELAHHLEMCDYISAKQVMDKVFLDLSYCNPDKFRKYMRRMIEMLMIRIRDFENALLLHGQDYQFQIDYLNTYRDLKSYMNSVLQGTIEYLKMEREKRSKNRIELAKKFIRENYHKQINLNDVAEYVELNASYFSNLFKIETGMNFSDFLLDVRMDNAKQLLRNPKIKVYEIGNLVGYEDAVSFGRAFKKKLGMSPKEYRNSVY